MPLSPESLYRQLGALITNRPPLEGQGDYGAEQFEWLGRVTALIGEMGDGVDIGLAKAAASSMQNRGGRTAAFGDLMVTLYRALARAEQAVPANSQGAFIDVGQGFTALQAVTKVLSSAKRSVLVVDPYLSQTALFDFIPSVNDGVLIKLLCDGRYAQLNAELRVGVARWQQQFDATKPIEARATAPRSLHDRLIIIDGSEAWNLSQSLKDFATRSPASLVRSDNATAELKIPAYEAIWEDAEAL